MDVTYIALIDNIWLSMMMFVATGFYPALKLLRRCAPEINLNARPKQDPHETQYSLLDDGDHRDAVQQRFMLKQLPRMLAMIALGACHMALMLDVRNTCATMNANASNVLNWMC
jgi:hypothetical protein